MGVSFICLAWHLFSLAWGGPLDDAGDVLQSSPVSVVPDTTAIDEASKVIKGLAQIPAPSSINVKGLLDPKLDASVETCDRDYSMMCPDQFVNVGPIFGGTTEYCAASSDYDGPCASEAHTFDGMTIKAKARWSKLCQTSWPCILCERDYSAVCPEGWTQLNSSLSCAPPPAYAGPCRGGDTFEYTLGRDTSSLAYLKMVSTDFSGYNAAMMQHWSAECGAFWPCSAGSMSLQSAVTGSSFVLSTNLRR